MEAARAKKSKLMTLQKEEDEKILNMADWSPEKEADESEEPVMSRADNVGDNLSSRQGAFSAKKY